MRVAIDARELQDHPTGVGRYLTALLTHWRDVPAARECEFLLCSHAPVHLPDLTGLRVATRMAGHVGGTRWEQLTLPGLLRAARADVLFAPAYTAPLLTSVPVVLAIHDVSFAAHPEWFSWREGLRRRTLARLSARRARRVLTISEFSRAEIVRHLGTDPAKILVTPLGPGRGPGATDAALPPRGTDEDLLLYVGSVFERRHVPELVEAFARLAARRPRARLAIVGDNRTRPVVDLDAVARRCGVADRVSRLDFVDDATLATLYHDARGFVFLSAYEGFGLTPLEALTAGVPVLLLDTPVAREVCGDAAAYVGSTDPGVIADALERLLYDDAERGRLADARPAVLDRYSWSRCAAATFEAITAP